MKSILLRLSRFSCLALFGWPLLSGLCTHAAPAPPISGWLSWRGPSQNGSSLETNLPERIDGARPLWSASFPGASTPVIANGRLYVMGYIGEGADLQEGVACFNAESGQKLWQQLFSDFLSDTVYNRYATSSPVIDPETGNVYVQGTQGLLAGFTSEGKLLWEQSMMELYGRLTFPNARTVSPLIDKDLLITRGITANWGGNGPASDRFYGFDKKTGELVWTSTPGVQPKDNSYSLPYLTFLDGKRVFIASTGDGSVVCGNARTGDPIWRVPLTKAGINATVLVHSNQTVVAVYGTPYEPGQMVAFKIPKVTPSTNGTSVTVDRSQVEIWSRDISSSASSPILVGDRIYIVAEKGDLSALDVHDGRVLWTLPLGIEERNSCPLFADGKLYVPILDDPSSKTSAGSETGSKGGFYVIQPGDKEGKILAHVALDGRCFGSPTPYNGKIYLQTTQKIYAFGARRTQPATPPRVADEPWPQAGPAAQLQIVPSEVLLQPGEAIGFRVRKLDANGFLVENVTNPTEVKWASYIPATARVRSKLNADFDANGKMVAAKDLVPSAGAFEATLGDLKGYIRGRVLPALPLTENFESYALAETTTNSFEPATKFAFPPLPWIGARFKFEVRDHDGQKVLTKTIDNKFLQRATVFIGNPNMKNYTIEADVMSDGDRRKMSEVGVINQRYAIVLKGNEHLIEVSSNLERLRVSKEFTWAPNTWYHLKGRVDVATDGSGVIRAKAWKAGETEPTGWLLEVPVKHAHQSGSPGLFGFAPQDMRVHVDNISVKQN